MATTLEKQSKLTTAAAPPLVVSYLRFSTKGQAKGDSYRRQAALGERWAAERGLKISDSLADLGISAFKGANVRDGALGEFLALVKAGKIPAGSVLMVESLDRLSRNQLLDALSQFLEIVRAGVRLVTLGDNYEYSRDRCDLQNLTYSLMVMSRAHEESAIKSQRCGAAWAQKRKLAASNKLPMTAQLPGWLLLNETGKIEIDRAKAAAVKKVYELSLQGMGCQNIAKEMRAGGFTPIGKTGWKPCHLNRILKGRAVLGEFQPHTCVVEADGVRRRKPAGAPVPGFFPAVIDETTWLAVQASFARRSKNKGGRSDAAYVNPFLGIGFYDDGGNMRLIKSRMGKRYYVSTRTIDGSAAVSQSFPVEPFELGFFMRIGEVADSLAQTNNAPNKHDIAAATARLSQVEGRITAIVEAATENNLSADSLVRTLAKLEAEKVAQQKALDALRSESLTRSRSAVESLVTTFMDLQAKAMAGSMTPDQRIRARDVIRQLVSKIEVKVDTCSDFSRKYPHKLAHVCVTLVGGREVIFTIDYRRSTSGGMKVRLIPFD